MKTTQPTSLVLLLVLCLLAGMHVLEGEPIHAADPFALRRIEMVEHEIVGAGIKNDAVINSIKNTPRHEFVLSSEKQRAYLDMALPIGEGQTISPPFIVAFMTESLDPQPTDKVLEIGTGSGYQAAVLSPLVKDVYSIEIVEPLGRHAAKTLKRLKYKNVHTKIGDGYLGWPEHAPFDKIIVTCSPEEVPQALVDQLADGGRMVIPVGERYQQTMYLFLKQEGKLKQEKLLPTLFVPMTGKAEEQRKVQPDPLHPTLLNADFEELDEDKSLAHWYYQRQVGAAQGENVPQGKQYARFFNSEPGRGSQMLQAMAVDGTGIEAFEFEFHLLLKNVSHGQNVEQLPILAMAFYDKNRKQLAYRWLGPWTGNHDWRVEIGMLKVPTQTSEVVLQVGLQGAVGEMGIDDLKVTAVHRQKAKTPAAP